MRTASIQYPTQIPLGEDFFGVTTGNLSLVDILAHVLDHTGRIDVSIVTWSVGMRSLRKLMSLNTSSVRLLIDRSYATRHRTYNSELLRVVGQDNIRYTRVHAKFIVLGREVVIHSSMNLNTNIRYESVSIHYQRDVAGFLLGLVDDWFARPFVPPADTRGCNDAYVAATQDEACKNDLDLSFCDLPLKGV